jgi:PPM family protein phosphatase
MALFLRYAAASHQGFDRPSNEDSAYAGRRLLAVADGVGGSAAGEVASSIVIRELARLDANDQPEDVLDSLGGAIGRANDEIAGYIRHHPSDAGMGTTVTALLFTDDHVGVVHVGDSRAHLLRDGTLSQMTKDETFVQSLVDAGTLTPDEARAHPRRSVILRAVDGGPLAPRLERHDAKRGDRYLVCSDGVSDVLPTETLARRLSVDDPQECAFPLVLEAIRAGSRDNVTCVAGFVTDRDFGYNIPLMLGAGSHTFV